MAAASGETGVSLTPRQLAIAALLFLMMLLNYLDRVILSLVSPALRAELHLTAADYAHAVNAFLMAYAVMYIGSGLIIDRTGARRGIAISVTLWSLVSLMHAGIRNMRDLVLWRVLLGATEPGGWTGAVKLTSERFLPAQRGVITGAFTAGAGIGALVAPPLVVWLTIQYGWRAAFAVSGIAGLLWIPVWLLVLRQEQPSQSTARPSSTFRERLAWVGRNPRCLAYLGTRFFGDTTGYFFLFWLPEYLITSKKFTFGAVGTLGWIPFLFNDAGALLGGYLSGRLIRKLGSPVRSRKVAMSCAAVFVIAGTLIQHAESAPAVLLSVSLCTFGVGVWASNMHAVAADAFPESVVATIHGLAGCAGSIGGILFNTLVAHFAGLGDYTIVFVVLSLLQPAGVAPLWLWLPRSLQQRERN